ncbi:protein containing DUF820 [Candidatus Moduliflexus flocculans]|uniref:Protein containing DUF820 n=1 Tax=Candidatus Moduliflexus flocculans TaxID=1499966 RepID=A0A081BTJ2_9BACT|nr:protein containing DUF820 [Candidatus Moduliflexus flocculans]
MTPSKLRSYLQSKVNSALRQFPQFTVFLNLTIAINGVDYIPAVCVYPKLAINFFEPDEIRMTQLPLMAVEIVSPTQTIQEVLDTFPIYFQAGIRSCWLVVPQTKTVAVYTAPTDAQVVSMTGDVVDSVLDIRVPLDQIFA